MLNPAPSRNMAQRHSERSEESMRILGVRLDLLTKQEALATIERQLLQPVLSSAEGPTDIPYIITTLNAECLVLAADDPAYRETLNRSSLNLPDGIGVIWAARLRGARPLERIPGSDLIYDLARLCRTHGRRLFLLGAAPAPLSAALTRLRNLYPGIEVSGYSPSPTLSLPALSPAEGSKGPHHLPPQEEQVEERVVLERLASFSPHLLCVAFGMPRQELWIAEHRDRLRDLGVSLAVGVGGAIDYAARVLPRAPQPLQRLGLEWLYRLWREPRKRLPRQATRLPRFVLLASLESLRLRRPH